MSGERVPAGYEESWDWRVLLVESPMCGMGLSPDAVEGHQGWHWLTKTETRVLES